MSRLGAHHQRTAGATEASVNPSTKTCSRAPSEATTRGSSVPAVRAGSASDMPSTGDNLGFVTQEGCSPQVQQPASQPSIPPPIDKPAAATLRQRLAQFVCCVAPQVQESSALDDVATRLSTTKYIIQPAQGQAAMQCISLLPTQPAAVQGLGHPAATAHLPTPAQHPPAAASAQPSATDLVAPPLHTADGVIPASTTQPQGAVSQDLALRISSGSLGSRVARLSQAAASGGSKQLDDMSEVTGTLSSVAVEQPDSTFVAMMDSAQQAQPTLIDKLSSVFTRRQPAAHVPQPAAASAAPVAASPTAPAKPFAAAVAALPFAVEAPCTPTPALHIPAPMSGVHLSPQPAQQPHAAAEPPAVSSSDVPRKYSMTRWGIAAEVEEEGGSEEAGSDGDEYWDARSYSSFATAHSQTGTVSPRDSGTLLMPTGELTLNAAPKQAVPGPLFSSLLVAVRPVPGALTVPHSASTPSVQGAAADAGKLSSYRYSSANALLSTAPAPLKKPPVLAALPAAIPEMPPTVFRADMQPHLPAFEKARQAPRKPYGPHKPLPFLDPDTTYLPVPAVTGYCGFWRKVPERSSPLPMPIDVMLNANWVMRRTHESIQAIKLDENERAVTVKAKVNFMGAPIIHKEVYMKDNSMQISRLRRDIKPGFMEFRSYWTAGGELVLSVECYSLGGRLDNGGVEVVRLIDGGDTLHCQQACYDYLHMKGAVQEFVGKRAPFP